MFHKKVDNLCTLVQPKHSDECASNGQREPYCCTPRNSLEIYFNVFSKVHNYCNLHSIHGISDNDDRFIKFFSCVKQGDPGFLEMIRDLIGDGSGEGISLLVKKMMNADSVMETGDWRNFIWPILEA